MWPLAAPVVGVCSVASVFVPYPGGLAGIAGGVAGIAAGVVGITGARRAAAPTSPTSPAVAGIVVSALAIAAGIAMVFVYVGPAGAVDGPADEASAEVLDNDLDVVIGAFDDLNPDARSGRLPVTLTNKLDETAEYTVAIAAFGGDGHQIDSETTSVVLAADCSEDHDMFRFGAPERLKSASFRIIAARKVIRWHG
jgi:hypothetical protein